MMSSTNLEKDEQSHLSNNLTESHNNYCISSNNNTD